MDNRVNNKGTIGNKGGSLWTPIDREMWTKLKNESVKLALEAIYGDDKKFKQAVILKMLNKCTDVGELAGKLELVIKEHGDSTIQSEPVAEESSTGQS